MQLKHIKLCLRNAYENGLTAHPQEVMSLLGIQYSHSTPQSTGDMWQFWNCSNIPEELPKGLTIEDWNPLEWVGYGLSEVKAKEIMERAKCN